MGNCTCTAGGALGIALAGGGARAVAQLGVLKVLDRAGMPVGRFFERLATRGLEPAVDAV